MLRVSGAACARAGVDAGVGPRPAALTDDRGSTLVAGAGRSGIAPVRGGGTLAATSGAAGRSGSLSARRDRISADRSALASPRAAP
jgi:hypothetical protein